MANGHFCTSCGKQNSEHSRFCGECGQALYDPISTKSDLSSDPKGKSAASLQKGESSIVQVVPYILVGLLFISSIISYLDRVNISIAAPVMMEDLGWDTANFSQVFSAFLFGYMLLAFPAGILADRWNAYKILAFSLVGCSIFTALTPLGSLDQGLTLAARFGVGMFAAMSLPAYAALNARWFSRYGYGLAQTLSVAGNNLGQLLGYPLTIWLVKTFSWPVVFYCSALLGGVWLVAWLAFTRSLPTERSKYSAVELYEVEVNQASRPSVPASPWAVVLVPQVLLLALSYFCSAFSLWTVTLWLPSYLIQVRGVSIQEMGQIGMIPAIASFVGLVGGGVLSDALLRRGFTTRFARVQGPSLCLALAAPFLVTATLASQASVTVACFAVYFFLTGLASGGYWAVPLEISPTHVGAISGAMVCAGAAANLLGSVFLLFFVSDRNHVTANEIVILFQVATGIAVMSSLLFYFLVFPGRVGATEVRKESPLNNIAGGIAFALFGLLVFLWASRHSPHMGLGDMVTQGMSQYILKEPLYTFILLFAAALGLLGIALFVLGLVAQSKRS